MSLEYDERRTLAALPRETFAGE
ncbi:hypothetical protein NB231_05926 [Nitrococcus mobilis Nb-231]|uniref:Uncharacterized protein n=1 Tax=Nitrococcus mobilis Nb-231 TaxID=314278 RepID=A4BQQ2_9GAMM|nr:hypothetical protein NB231_05926 [Nitrococcus mobilis Nb-231]